MKNATTTENLSNKGTADAGHHAEVVKGEAVRIYGVDTHRVGGPVDYSQTFQVGDEAVARYVGCYAVGSIVAVGEKTVTVDYHGQAFRLSLFNFSRLNRCRTTDEARNINRDQAANS